MVRQRGDTLIEVLFAVTAFGLVAVGTLSLMNRGLAMAQRSLELSQVRLQLDSQAELLRFLHEQKLKDETGPFAAEWSNITTRDKAEELVGESTCPASLPRDSFYMVSSASGVRTANQPYTPATVYARVNGEQSEGLSIQIVKVEGGRAYDAYIQACWYSVGSDQPMTIGTIVRLYDPKA